MGNVFDIAMGFRRNEPAFKAEINRQVVRNRVPIEATLARDHVPLWQDHRPPQAIASETGSNQNSYGPIEARESQAITAGMARRNPPEPAREPRAAPAPGPRMDSQ